MAAAVMRCIDALTLPMSDWLFGSEGEASFDRAAILSIAFFSIQNFMRWHVLGIL